MGQPSNIQFADGTMDEVKTDPVRPSKLDRVYGRALEGDMRGALHILEEIPNEALNTHERAERDGLWGRFISRKLPSFEAPDSLVAGLIGVYREYWMKGLLREVSVADGSAYLFESLTSLLSAKGLTASFTSLDELFEDIATLLVLCGRSTSIGKGTFGNHADGQVDLALRTRRRMEHGGLWSESYTRQ